MTEHGRAPNWPDWAAAAFTVKGLEMLERVYERAKAMNLERPHKVSAEDIAIASWSAWRVVGRWDLIEDWG